MQHTYFIAWPRIMKIGLVYMLFAVTRSKKKRRVHKIYNIHYFIAWPRIMKIGLVYMLFAVTRSKKKRRVHKICNIHYFIAWPRIMKIRQIDVLFTVTRSKMKHRVTYIDSFNPFPNDKLYTLSDRKSLQTTVSNMMKIADRKHCGKRRNCS